MDANGFDNTGLKILFAAVIHDAAKCGNRVFFKGKWFELICAFMDWEPGQIRELAASGVKTQFTIPREFKA